MSEPVVSGSVPSASERQSGLSAAANKTPATPPERVFLVPYPKIVFLYPTLVMSVVAAIIMGVSGEPLDSANRLHVVTSVVFLTLFAVNLVILAFDFPRTTSLTLFFFGVALVLGGVLLITFKPDVIPFLQSTLQAFQPMANSTFYWLFASMLALIYIVVMIAVRFDYWEVRPNELLHHHGFLSNLERLSAPNMRIEKEINDVFEYLLLGSGRLILQSGNERRAIILDNVPFIRTKEEAITRMLGALQVQVREGGGA